jgi:hypothetical protein
MSGNLARYVQTWLSARTKLTFNLQIQIDELTKYYGMKPTDYEAVRCGMNVSKAIIEGSIHAGIGLENVSKNTNHEAIR